MFADVVFYNYTIFWIWVILVPKMQFQGRHIGMHLVCTCRCQSPVHKFEITPQVFKSFHSMPYFTSQVQTSFLTSKCSPTAEESWNL